MRIIRLVAIALAVGAVACTPSGVAQPELAGCDQTTDFAFAGETTLSALGIPDIAGGQQAVRPGMVWVTAGPVEVDRGPAPPDARPEPQPPSRMVCIQFADGSGVSTSIAADWTPPPGLISRSGEGSGFPILITVAVVVVLLGVSLLAFRGDRGGS